MDVNEEVAADGDGAAVLHADHLGHVLQHQLDDLAVGWVIIGQQDAQGPVRRLGRGQRRRLHSRLGGRQRQVEPEARPLAFPALGQNLEAARSSGIDPTAYRVLNWTLSCALAGWLGGFYAHYYGILTPDLLHTSKTVEVLAETTAAACRKKLSTERAKAVLGK